MQVEGQAGRPNSEPVSNAEVGHPERFSFGPVAFRTWAADVRHVRWADVEIIRRIFVTVRDSSWLEVPPTAWSYALTEDTESLQLHLVASHEDDGIDFSWRGRFAVEPSLNRLSFSMSGHVRCDMEINRLGLVVLHPQQALIGGSLTTLGPSGEQTLDVLEELHPQPIVNGLPTGMTLPFDTLTANLADGGSLRFVFAGELFEIEDQRNFGDSSFKSYCPPLAAGFPTRLKEGTEIAHGTTCVASLPETPLHDAPVGGSISLFPVNGGTPLPRIGLELSSDRSATSRWAPFFSYVRFDVAADANPDEFDRMLAVLNSEQGLELGLVIGPEGDFDERLLTAVVDHDCVTRILLLDRVRSVIDIEIATPLYEALQRHGCRVPVCTAVNGYFVDVNRGESVELLGSGLAIAVSPTVHSGDVLTVSENVAALPYIVQSARKLFPAHEVLVSTLTLHQGPVPAADVYDRAALPWFVATLDILSRIGVSTMTLGGDVLPDHRDRPKLSEAWSDVLDLLERAERSSSLSLPSSGELHVVAWHERPDHLEMLIANLADDNREVILDGAWTLVGHRTIWKPFSGSPAHIGSGSREIMMPGFGVVHVEMRGDV